MPGSQPLSSDRPDASAGVSLREAKAALRREIRGHLEALAEKDERSRRICMEIAAHPRWKEARVVGTFAALPVEPDVELLWADAAGKVVCYPRMRPDGLEMLAVSGPAELISGKWGLREPADDPAKVAALAELDLVLVPAFVFARDGRRLGRGGGFYDRLLGAPGFRAYKIGVCFEVQLRADLPMESHDQRVDAVITERGWG